jgi:fibronectin type III domain protein
VSSLLRVVIDPDLTAPGIPSLATPTVVSQTRLDLSWTPVLDTGGSGLAGYEIFIDSTTIVSTGGVQTTYSATGFTAGTTHTFQVRSFDGNGNRSQYSNQVSATTAAALPTYNPEYPRFGSYALGGTQNASNAALAAVHVNVVPHYPGWQQSKGVSWASKAATVKTLSTIGTIIVPYTIYTEIPDVNATAGQANWEVWQRALTNNLWVFQNGATETTKIAADVAGSSKLNYTTAGKLVAGETFAQWKLRWDYSLNVTGASFPNGLTSLTVTANPTGFSGTFLDNIFAQERPASGTGATGDYDRDGTQDALSGAVSRLLIQSSHAANAAFCRTLKADGYVLGNSADWPIWYPTGVTGTPLDQAFDGGVLEHLQQWVDGTRGSTMATLLNAIAVQMNAYKAPKLGIASVLISSATNYSSLRWWHGVCLLTDTYFYPHLTTNLLAEELGTLNYDERDFRLGAALEGTQYTARYQSGANGAGIYRRDFANGIVLVAAPTGTYAAVSLGGTFYRLNGTRDTTWNNAQAVTSVTLSAGQAIVLSRTPTSSSSSGGFTPASSAFTVQAPNGIAHGQPLVITRTSGSWAARTYSSKPWLYDLVSQQFKDGVALSVHSGRTDGSSIPDPGADAIWSRYNSNNGAASAKYSTSRPMRHAGVTATYLMNTVDTAMKFLVGPPVWPNTWNGGVQNNPRLYATWWAHDKQAYNSPGGPYQHKLSRYNSTSLQGVGSCEFNGDSFQYSYGSQTSRPTKNSQPASADYWVKASNNQYVRYEMYLDMVNGIAEGYCHYRYQRGGISGAIASGFSNGEFEYRSPASALYDANPSNVPFTPGWSNVTCTIGYDGNSTATHSGQEIEIGEIYVDTEWERFEISNSPTWNVAPAPLGNLIPGTPREIQGRWSRDSASVATMYLNQGQFSSLSGKYLWYVDGFKTATLIGQFT